MKSGWTERWRALGGSLNPVDCFFSPLLALPSRIDDSSRKPCLLDLSRSAMICSPGVLHARPSNSSSSLSLSLSLSLPLSLEAESLSPSSSSALARFSIRSLPPAKSFPPILQGSSSAASASPRCRDAPPVLFVFAQAII